jgi:hypothetical protein
MAVIGLPEMCPGSVSIHASNGREGNRQTSQPFLVNPLKPSSTVGHSTRRPIQMVRLWHVIGYLRISQ